MGVEAAVGPHRELPPGPTVAHPSHRLAQEVSGAAGGVGPALPQPAHQHVAGSRCRGAALPHSASQSARAGHAKSPADRRPCGRGSLQPRQRHPAGQTRRLGRTLPGAGRPLHGSVGSQPPQPCYPGLLPEAAGSWQTEKGGAGRVHAQTAGYSQRHAQTWLPLVRYNSASRRSFMLTLKTASVGCSSFRAGFLFQKPLSPRPGALSHPFTTPTHSSPRWIGAYPGAANRLVLWIPAPGRVEEKLSGK